MVNSENINDKMVKYTVWFLIVLLTLLEVCVRTQMSVRDSNHGFLQNNNEVRYLVDVDDISTIHKGYTAEVRSPKLQDALVNSWLRFEPEFLDFKERPLGVPHLEKVTLYNVNSNKSVDMTSISGNTVHFHSSFFEDKVIPPLGNTTFNVVFLGREEGEIESSLFIHTKEGTYKYQVKGSSVASPYRLRPIVDIRVPLNVSFSPLIYMHNPHTYPIQIVEVYSSGGDFHLELPTGELEGPKDMWEIPPFQTKPVIRVRFNARLESNYTAYVRIKVSNIDEVLVVPLEVEVSSQHGLFTPQGTIDFGIGGTLDQPRQVKLMVYNTMKKLVRIQSVISSSKAVKVDFQPVKVLPDLKEPTEIASLTVDWKSAYETKEFFGKIRIRYKQGKSRLEIPYWVTVFDGGLSYNDSVTKYLVDGEPLDNRPREFTVTNKYQFPLAVTNISLPKEANSYFSIQKFKSIILKPGESAVLFILTLIKYDVVNVNFNFQLRIHTNITTHRIPVVTYDGRLKLMLPNSEGKNTFDLGLVGADSLKEAHFILINNNPVEIDILNYGASTTTCKVTLIGCAKDNIDNDVHIPSNVTKCTSIKTGLYAIFRIVIDTSRKEGLVSFQVNIQTKFETVSIPVKLKVSNGNLEIGPDRLVFDECFPGKICTHPLRIHSTYNEPMVIQSIASIPPDPRLSSTHSGHITTRSTRIVGHLFLDPGVPCSTNNNCYTGFPVNTSLGLLWLETFATPINMHEYDYTMLNIFYGRYLNMTSGGKRWQNLTLRLDTSEVKGHFFQSRVKLSWPKLVVGHSLGNRSIFSFPLTQIGQTTFRNITLKNPSDSVLLLQLIMDWSYPQTKNNIKMLPNSFCPGGEETYESHAFFFHENHSLTRSKFESETEISSHENTVPIILKPRETIDIMVGFKATVSTLRSALMYIRNNLTMLEIIRLTGQGANPNFRFGNRKPGSNMPLLFELTEKHLKDCEKEKNRKNPSPNLTVKRSFTARNTGDVMITINSFSINGFPCEGYGFKVLNCVPFELPPNSTKKIEIAFTPDFTLSKIQRVLILETSLNIPVNYTLVTTLPPYFLAPCSSVLARPTWEPLLYYACVSLMTFLLLIVISVCFIESDRILRTTLIVRDDSDTQPLDLRLIGTQTRNEIRTPIKLEQEAWNGLVTNGQQTLNKCLNKDLKVLEPVIQCNKSSWTTEQNIKETIKCNDDQKYSAVTPAQPSKINKKKVTKKNSTDNISSEICQEQKKCWNSNKNKQNVTEVPDKKRVTPTQCINKSEPKKDSPIQKDVKRQSIKKLKNNDAPCSEEETSSTTTESSNNEEVEKYTDAQSKKDKVRKNVFKKNKSPNITSQACDFRDNYEGDGEEDEFERDSNVVNRWKTRSENKKEAQEYTKTENKSNNDKENNKRSFKNNGRERKEKKEQKKRQEKTIGKNSLISENNININTRISPPVPPIGVWGENRATFSDVVARSDSSFFTSPVQRTKNLQTVTSKPTLYVEPTQKQKEAKPSPSELGPIGSKKADWNEVSRSNFTPQHTPVKPQLSNSFFTEPQHGLAADSQNSYFDVISVPDVWNNQDSSLDFIQNGVKDSSTEDVASLSPLQANWNCTNFWEPLCTPVGENRPQTSIPNDYFWSTPSSSLWSSSPWAPVVNPIVDSFAEGTSLPTRSPPGFNCNDNESDRQEILQGGFDPFRSLSNIWTPHSPGYWNSNNSSSQ